MNRRDFLAASAASTVLGSSLAVPSRAAVSAADRKFVFVFASGGWDTTRVFASAFGNAAVDMEPGAEPVTTSGLPWVDHPERPSVRAFMEAWASRALVFNGVLVRSIAHEICTMISMTGDSSGLKPDWPAMLATFGDQRRYTVPHLVLGGPSFPGPLGASVARTGGQGQLEALVSGEIRNWADVPQQGMSLPAQNLVDRYARGRAASQKARVPDGAASALYAAYADAVSSATSLKDLRYTMDFTGGVTLAEQAEVAVDALSVGMSRCVTVQAAGAWDTHSVNDPIQSQLFEQTFQGLNQLMALLGGAEGANGGTLLDETMVVVLSEMGRTPQLNGFLGKDHWPYTSMMLLGSGITGGRAVGGHDALFYGLPVDPSTGEVSDSAQLLSAEAVGATLLQLADIDPAEHIQGVDPIVGVLS